jgi:hypothetical protein
MSAVVKGYSTCLTISEFSTTSIPTEPACSCMVVKLRNKMFMIKEY